MDPETFADLLAPAKAVLSVTVDLGPLFLVIVSVLLYFVVRKRGGTELRQDRGSSEQSHRYGLAEDKADTFAGDAETPKTIAGKRNLKKRRLWPFIFKLVAIVSVVPGIAGTMDYLGISWHASPRTTAAQADVVDKASQEEDAASKFKSRETTIFRELSAKAKVQMERGQVDRAKSLFSESLALGSIPLADAASSFAGLAEMLIDEDRLDAAEQLAFIAAELDPKNPDFVNPYTELLLTKCEVEIALDWLNGLELNKDARSEELVEQAHAKRSNCPAS